MSLTILPNTPFFEGDAQTPEVPARWPVALAGRGFLLDTEAPEHGWRAIPLMREQVDMGPRPGEASLNPLAGWRRSAESWHLGAGQDAYDRLDSDPFRFHSSKGVDPWTPWQLGLLHDVTELDTEVGADPDHQHLAVTGTRLWWVSGDTVSYWSGSAFTATDYNGGDVEAVASTGDYLYVADVDGIHRVAAGAATFAMDWNTNITPTVLGFVNGRLLAGEGSALFEVVDDSTSTPHYQHPSADARWRGFASAPNAIFAAAQVGDVGLIYRIGVDPDTGALATPTVAATFVGEVIHSLHGYANTVLLIGTGDGFRVATITGSNLLVGARVATGRPVRTFAGWQQWVWFGWDQFDNESAGLGRIDLTRFTTDLNVFAYASDLMGHTNGDVPSVVVWDGKLTFVVADDDAHVYVEADEFVESGWLRTGEITYGIGELKTLEAVTVAGDDTLTVDVEVAVDGADWRGVGTIDMAGDRRLVPPAERAERIDLRFTLHGGAMRRWSLEAEPAGTGKYLIVAPLLLHEQEMLHGGAANTRDVESDIRFVLDVWRTGRIVQWQEGGTATLVRVTGWQWRPEQRTHDLRAWNGTLVIEMKVV